MPCLPCGARKLSVRARLQMSATDVARRTEMELKVDQKVLCGEIERLEDMEQERREVTSTRHSCRTDGGRRAPGGEGG